MLFHVATNLGVRSRSSHRNTSFFSISARCVASEHLSVQRKGRAAEFISQRSDADLLFALPGNRSSSSQGLLRAVQKRRSPKRDNLDAEVIGETEGLCGQNVVVRIDSRERKLLDYVHEHHRKFRIDVETLRVGDVIVGSPPNEIFIERKSVPDLVNSIMDARLHNQIGNTLHATGYERFRSLVIVEGRTSDVFMAKHGIQKKMSHLTKRQMVFKTVVRLSLRDQIPVLFSSNIAGTFELIRTIVDDYPKICHRPEQYSSRIDKPFRPRRGEDPKLVLADQLRCVRGISLRTARSLAGKHRNIKTFLAEMGEADNPVEWLKNRFDGGAEMPNRSTAARLAEALGGPEAVASEKFVQSLATVQGVSSSVARALAKQFQDEARLCQALETHSSAPEPVRRAMNFAKMSHPTARRLVSKFLGTDALAWDDLVRQVAQVRGLSSRKAGALVDHFGGSKTCLLEALKSDMERHKSQKVGANTNLRLHVAEELLSVLEQG